MRIAAFIWIVFACAAGVAVMLLKHDVDALEARLAAANKQIRSDQEAIHVLNAEWSYLNDPVRLRDLAEKHLGLTVTHKGQITSFADLPGLSPPLETASQSPGAGTSESPPYPLAADGSGSGLPLEPTAGEALSGPLPPLGGFGALRTGLEAVR